MEILAPYESGFDTCIDPGLQSVPACLVVEPTYLVVEPACLVVEPACPVVEPACPVLIS